MSLVVEQSGHGPKLTLVHGWAMHSGLFARLTARLDGYTVQRVDLPGHGRNRERPWPDQIDELVDELVEVADGGWLIGWSLGGLLSLMAALAAPSRLRGLVLIAATPCFGQRPHWPHGVSESLVTQLSGELAKSPEQVLNRFLALEVHGSNHAAADLRLLKAEAFRHGLPDQTALSGGLKLLQEADLTGRLDEITCPVGLIGGRRDKLVSYAALEDTASALPNSQLTRIAGAAHAPFLTDPDAVAAAITALTKTS